MVALKKRVHPKKEKAFNKDAFEYDEKQDIYLCPENHSLTTNGTWYKKNKGKYRKAYKVKHYKPDSYQVPFAICNACPTASTLPGRPILKTAKVVTLNDQNTSHTSKRTSKESNSTKHFTARDKKPSSTSLVPSNAPDNYREGYNHTLLKGKKKVTGEPARLRLVCHHHHLLQPPQRYVPTRRIRVDQADKSRFFFCKRLVCTYFKPISAIFQNKA